MTYEPTFDPSKTYEALVAAATTLRRQGKFGRAATLYRDALNSGPLSADQAAVASQQLAVTFRLEGSFADAEEYFDDALNFAVDNPVLAAKIKRDLAMCMMDEARRTSHLGERQHLMTKSYGLLGDAHKVLEQAGETIEAAVTWGFIGRHNQQLGYRATARTFYYEAGRILRSKDNSDRDLELDNLVWYLTVARLKARRQLFARAWQLTKTTGQSRRRVQLLGAVVSADQARDLLKHMFGK